MSAEVRRSRIAVGAARPRLIEAGPAEAAEAVVFVHGNPGSCDDWGPLAKAAGGLGLRALALDLPDFGKTEAPPGFEHTPRGYAAFLGEALVALGVERVHLVVHDFGGPIGLTWAAEHGDMLASMTLINTGVLPGYEWHTMARVWRTPVAGEVLQAITTRNGFRLGLSAREPRGLPRQFVDQMYDRYDKRTKRAVLKLYRATDDPSGLSAEVTPKLAPLDVPALVIWGEHDAYIPASYAERQREAFPSADVHLLPVSGHWPFADEPETVERLLLEFLARTAPVAA